MIIRTLAFFTLLFLCVHTKAQQTDTVFQKEWLDIDTLILKQDLTRTALTKTKLLYRKAKKRQLSAQVIKCLIYEYALEERITDEEPNKLFAGIQSAIKTAGNETEAAILHSLLARQYLNYYNNHRWNLYGRESGSGSDKNDIATWGTDELTNAISQHFLLSLRNKALLQQTKLSAYNAIILQGNNRQLRPTLFDLLAQEALDYFASGENYLNKPQYAFSIANPHALDGLNGFLEAVFTTKDSSDLRWQALQLYQLLLRFHRNDTNKESLVNTDLERIKWVYENAVFENKDARYSAALALVKTNYPNVAPSAEAWYLLAKQEADKARSFRPFADTANRYGFSKARAIIVEALERFSQNDENTQNLRGLLADIDKINFSTSVEKVNIPGKPFRSLIRYRNLDTIYQRIIRTDALTANDRNNWKKIAGLPVYRAISQPLPVTDDYQEHSTEAKTDALPVGAYALLSSDKNSFNPASDKMSISFFYVSNISYLHNVNDFFVVRRDNGQPLENASVSVFSNFLQKPVATGTTDRNGYFHTAVELNSYSTWLQVKTANDRLLLVGEDLNGYENYYQPHTDPITSREQYESDNKRVFFFTDRSIYRPGQTVYFKGIAITKDYETKLSKLVQSTDSGYVYLSDANNKKTDSLKIGLNSFGSFSGIFHLPETGLTGSFSISIPAYHYSATYFSVEEYKRPKFSVGFEKPKNSYRLSDSITITGMAKAFAGNRIDGAKIKYTIRREPDYRTYYGISNSYRPIPKLNAREIGHGEITSDAGGSFQIRFKALADDLAEINSDTRFNFVVNADVTDINGETHSASISVPIGFSSMILSINNPAVIDADSLREIGILATNLSGEKQNARVTVSIYPLKAPTRLIRKRYWQQPDQYLFSETAFTKYFPEDEYANESDYHTWPVEAAITSGTVATKNSSSFNPAPGSIPAGYYKIEANTTDSFGTAVNETSYIQVFSRNKNQLPQPLYNFSTTVKNEVQPGNTALFVAATDAPEIFVISRRENINNKFSDYQFSNREKGIHPLEYKTGENDRGSVGISEVFVYNNRIYSNLFNISVPWKNKELTISYASFRNKTEPGSKEQWTVNIEGNQGEKKAAELLTTMYDASLDAFRQHQLTIPAIWNTFTAQNRFSGRADFLEAGSRQNNYFEYGFEPVTIIYDKLGFDLDQLLRMNLHKLLNEDTSVIAYSIKKSIQQALLDGSEFAVQQKMQGKVMGANIAFDQARRMPVINLAGQANLKATAPKMMKDAEIKEQPNDLPVQDITVRKNFNETAFFFPQLYADSSGKYSFSFTMPEALTQWKWMSLAHTKDLAFGANSTAIVTQKQLMVQPNPPRFMREGDNMEFSSKIVNMSDTEITGQVRLELIDATTHTSVDGWFQNVFPTQYFTVEAGKSFAVKFPIEIPFSYNRPLTWRVTAYAGKYSDAEENILPVLTNRMLVTETLPIFLPSDTTLHFSFDKLLHNNSETLTQEGITVEYSSNPVWNAVQALPYLMEYPYECAEQSFNRFYANALASFIVNKYPRIKAVFEKWKTDSTALKSNLQKNEDLKQMLLEETPWVLQAENEATQKKNIALLFDLVKISNQTNALLEKLAQLQLPDGSFSWFKGGTADTYMTNYIITGFGKLKKLGVLSSDITIRVNNLLLPAIKYMDGKINDEYQQLIRDKTDLSKQQIGSWEMDYLYMRSFFRDIAQQSPVAYHYYYEQAKKFWVSQNNYYKAELALVFYRNGEERFVNVNIIPALRENAIRDPKMGMYWKTTYTCFWYQAPIEFQAMMISAFSEINHDLKMASLATDINSMKTWLLLNKQTNNWRTTVATADACYALLLNGANWLDNQRRVSIQLGNYSISSSTEKTEAGTGYFKNRIDGKQVVPEMGNIVVSTKSETGGTIDAASQSPSWGAVYWQYFEELDKITAAASPLSVVKKLFVEKNTDKGKILEPVKEGDELKIGDKVIVRLTLKSDREMEYLHLKDMRAASMEPLNVLSGYRWQDGLGYYESTRDLSSNFFISHLRKGTYVFDYPLFITHSGIFSVGIASIQSMYAPEFNSHSEGIKIRVAN